jgi:hypothetical protein
MFPISLVFLHAIFASTLSPRWLIGLKSFRETFHSFRSRRVRSTRRMGRCFTTGQHFGVFGLMMPSRKIIGCCVLRASLAVPWSKAERCCDGTSHGSFGLMQASRCDTGTAWSLSHAWPTPYPHRALPVLLMLRRLQQGLQTGCKTMFWRAAPQRRCCVRCCVAFSPIVNTKEACSCVRHFLFRTFVRLRGQRTGHCHRNK